MASLEMKGPYVFNPERIDKVVTKRSAGNYALGYTRDDGMFIVEYVGRSDANVNQELKTKLSGGYQKFKYSYATSAKSAFEKECRNYHDFGESAKLSNRYHPGRPEGTDWKCPVCKHF